MNRIMRLYFNFTKLLGIDVKIYFTEQNQHEKRIKASGHPAYTTIKGRGGIYG